MEVDKDSVDDPPRINDVQEISNVTDTTSHQNTTENKDPIEPSLSTPECQTTADATGTETNTASPGATGDLDPDTETSETPSETPVMSSGTTTEPIAVDDQGSEFVVPCIFHFDAAVAPIKVARAWSDYESTNAQNNFTKGCKWSPDGLCILSASDDGCLRLFNLPDLFYTTRQFDWNSVTEMVSILKMKEGDTIYDYAWYPLMNSMDPATCCLASTSRLNPVHLWDAFTGDLRATYLAYDSMDEVISANSLAFDPTGAKLYCGFNSAVRIFDVSRPGRQCTVCPLKRQGQPGIVSCLAVNPADHQLYAAGSYLRSIGVYDSRDNSQLYCLTGQVGGVTHLRFTADGERLYSGGRKDPEILCWDLRNPGKVLHAVSRNVVTNQRVYFDLDASDTFLVSGNDDGTVGVWNVREPGEPTAPGDDFLPARCLFRAHDDCVNGVSFNPVYPILATSSGQRKFEEPNEDSGDDEMFTDANIKRDNSIVVWWAGPFAQEE